MSTYYHVECVTCADASGNLGNRVEEDVVQLAAEWPAIKDALALVGRLRYAELNLMLSGQGFEFTDFMRTHADHVLDLVTEYGDRKPLLVGGAPKLSVKVVSCEALPDGMWAFVKNGKIVASNFEPASAIPTATPRLDRIVEGAVLTTEPEERERCAACLELLRPDYTCNSSPAFCKCPLHR